MLFGFPWAETHLGFALVFVSFGQAYLDLQTQLYHPSRCGYDPHLRARSSSLMFKTRQKVTVMVPFKHLSVHSENFKQQRQSQKQVGCWNPFLSFTTPLTSRPTQKVLHFKDQTPQSALNSSVVVTGRLLAAINLSLHSAPVETSQPPSLQLSLNSGAAVTI